MRNPAPFLLQFSKLDLLELCNFIALLHTTLPGSRHVTFAVNLLGNGDEAKLLDSRVNVPCVQGHDVSAVRLEQDEGHSNAKSQRTVVERSPHQCTPRLRSDKMLKTK